MNAENKVQTGVESYKMPPPRSLERGKLMARAFDLGVENVVLMSDEDLVAAIRRQEQALASSLLQ